MTEYLSLTRLSRWIERRSTWSLFAIAFVAMNLARYVLMQWITTRLGGGAWPPPLDLEFAYSSSTAFARVAAYGDQGRGAAPYFIFTGDLLYPIAYATCFAVLISLLARPLLLLHPSWIYLNLLPLAAFAADILENSSIAAMMGIYPTQPVWLGVLASIFTTTKWLFVVAMLLVPILLMISRIFQGQETRA